MDEDFSRQTRRFSAAILTYGKGKRRRMAGKRPLRRRSTVVNTGSKTIQENLGHATATFTLDVYGHVTDQMKENSASRMEQMIQSVSAG